jgi:cellulose synthase/poly-beta-1,6-N-acetylglucosamine synthase-like glycosyltransferase
MAAEIFFWASVMLAVYVYAGYPLLLAGLCALARRPVARQPCTPSVSLLICAHNEEAVIREKIQNSLALDYPEDRIEIVIASDGSADRTVEIARQWEGGRVRLLAYPENRGKIATMNDSVTELKGEIVVFSDATAMLEPDAIREIVTNFHDPKIGAVSGVYQVRRAEQSAMGGSESLYWRYETALRLQESALDSVLGGHGQLYAIRKSLYPFPHPGTINDDYVVPVRIVSLGYRAVCEPKAVCWEEAAEMAGFGRRVRIMAGNVGQLRELPRLLARPLPLFFFFSHKLGRLLVPFAMLIALAASAVLWAQPVYRLAFLAQLILYLLAASGALIPLRPKLLRLPYYFTMINVATFLGIYHALSGGRRMAWK